MTKRAISRKAKGRNAVKTTFQYRFYPNTNQKLELNDWLRISRYWYNRQLGDRFDWWEMNRTRVDACPLVSSIATLRDRPNFYGQKKLLPVLLQDWLKVQPSGELLDLSRVDASILQEVSRRVAQAFERFIVGDSNGNKSGRPRLKTVADFRTMTFADGKAVKLCVIRQHWMYIKLPKLGIVKVRRHRHLPEGFTIKQVSVTRKADGWYMQIMLEDITVPEFTLRQAQGNAPDAIIPTWENSMGIDAVLNEGVYLATSEGEQLPSLKPLRKNQAKLNSISTQRNKRPRGSRSRRKLAHREAKQHQRIARSRQDFQYKSAHKLVRTGKKVFFHEHLNLKGLTKRNKAKQDETRTFLPNRQSAKSGLNKSWSDAGFGNFFKTLDYIAAIAGAVVIPQKPAYSSMILCYRNEIIFTDCSIRDYWDEQHSLKVDRDINAAINLKRLGLDIFPSIKRRSGKLIIVGTMDQSTTKEILHTLHRAAGSLPCNL